MYFVLIGAQVPIQLAPFSDPTSYLFLHFRVCLFN